MLRDLPRLLIAAMEVKAVPERKAFAGGNREVARARGFLFKIMNTERVRGEQAVVANVPPGGMTRILWVIEAGNADDPAVHRAVIVTPRGAFAPGFAVAHAFAVY